MSRPCCSPLTPGLPHTDTRTHALLLPTQLHIPARTLSHGHGVDERAFFAVMLNGGFWRAQSLTPWVRPICSRKLKAQHKKKQRSAEMKDAQEAIQVKSTDGPSYVKGPQVPVPEISGVSTPCSPEDCLFTPFSVL